jgi:hypothetical protein
MHILHGPHPKGRPMEESCRPPHGPSGNQLGLGGSGGGQGGRPATPPPPPISFFPTLTSHVPYPLPSSIYSGHVEGGKYTIRIDKNFSL